MKNYKYFLVLTLFAFIATPSFAGEHGRDGHKGSLSEKKMEEHFKKMKEILNLSDEQYQMLQAHKKEHHAMEKEQRKRIMKLRKSLMNEIHKKDFDRSKSDKIHSESKNLKMQMMDERYEGMLKLREILTPEQMKKMHEHMKSIHEKRKGNKGFHE